MTNKMCIRKFWENLLTKLIYFIRQYISRDRLDKYTLTYKNFTNKRMLILQYRVPSKTQIKIIMRGST